ncbi:hypothetical protein SSPO_028810 [Streptomyces antimycoticus]|uniref:Isochorismatase-like domain-containing protein n=1 Tax=Streptomyces antimycoticus TaxID=68175 RepID=A0A499UFM2_9ACTN|nr:hypothetical protein SSPO_028810 [Streptomyces antimycoticus]
MPATTLDPNTALVLVDLQKGIAGLPTVHPTAEVIERGARLAAAFRKRGLPVVLVRVVAGAPGRTEAQGAAEAGSSRPTSPTSCRNSATRTATSWSPSTPGAPSTAPTSTSSCAAAG